MARENTKTCPLCGTQVLSAAHVCKHCRHRFDGDTRRHGEIDAKPSPGTLSAPASAQRRPPPTTSIWLLGAFVAVAIVIAIALASREDSGTNGADRRANQDDPAAITGSTVESKLDDMLQSRTDTPVSDVSCPHSDLREGDTLDCDVTFENGDARVVAVTVTGRPGKPLLKVSLK